MTRLLSLLSILLLSACVLNPRGEDPAATGGGDLDALGAGEQSSSDAITENGETISGDQTPADLEGSDPGGSVAMGSGGSGEVNQGGTTTNPSTGNAQEPDSPLGEVVQPPTEPSATDGAYADAGSPEHPDAGGIIEGDAGTTPSDAGEFPAADGGAR